MLKKICAALILLLGGLNQVHANTTSVSLLHPFKGPLGDAFNALIEQYNTNAPAPIMLYSFDEAKRTYEDIHAAIQNNFDGNTPPCIVFDYEMGTADDQNNTHLIGAEEFIEEVNKLSPMDALKLDVERITPTLRRFYSDAKGRLAAIPFNSNTVVVYVNTAFFKDKHFPKTWDEFEKVAKNLKQKYPDKKIIAFGWLHGHLFDQWAAINGTAIASENNGLSGQNPKLTLTNPQWTDWLVFIKNLYDQGIIGLDQGNDAEKNFNEGKTIFLAQGTGRVPFIKLDPKHVRVGLFPKFSASKFKRYTSISGGGAFWIYRDTLDAYHTASSVEKDKLLLKLRSMRDFLVFLMSDNVQNQWEADTGYLSVLAKTPQKISYKNNLFKETATIGRTSRENFSVSDVSSGIKMPHYQDIRKIQLETLIAFLKDDKAYFDAHQKYLIQKKFEGNIHNKAEAALEVIQNKGNELLDAKKCTC